MSDLSGKWQKKDTDKYFKLPLCVLEEMKFWEQTKSLGYTSVMHGMGE